MKRVLCMILTLAMLAGAMALAVTATAAANTLTVYTATGESVEVPVGQEVEFVAYLYSGEAMIRDGEGDVSYDTDFLEAVRVTAVNPDGRQTAFAYSMPLIVNCGKALNAKTVPGKVIFNFSSTEGIVAFTLDVPFFVYRFKAIEAGETTIAINIKNMSNTEKVEVFSDSVPNPQINPQIAYALNVIDPQTQDTTAAPDTQGTTAAPDTQGTTAVPDTQDTTAAPDTQDTTAAPETQDSTAGEEEYDIGDVDMDGNIAILDVTCIQRHLAKLRILTPEQQKLGDTDRNGIFDILDATRIQQYLARIIDTI